MSINDDGSVDLVCTSIAKSGSSYLGEGNYIEDGEKLKEANKRGGVGFGGAIGYTNGVYYLNDICAQQYSNKSLGVTARNIKYEDLEKHLNEEGKVAIQQGMERKEPKEYTDEKAYYPKLYAYENGSGIDTDNIKTDGIEPSDGKTAELSLPMSHSNEEEGYKKADKQLNIRGTAIQLPIAAQLGLFESKVSEKVLSFENTVAFYVATRWAEPMAEARQIWLIWICLG